MSEAEPHPATPKPKRGRFQYSLRTLLVVVTLCAIGMSWVAVRMQRARRQKEAVEALKASGGVSICEYAGPAWARALLGEDMSTEVIKVQFLSGSRIADLDLEQLSGLTYIESLDIRDIHVTDEDVRKLQKVLPNCRIER